MQRKTIYRGGSGACRCLPWRPYHTPLRPKHRGDIGKRRRIVNLGLSHVDVGDDGGASQCISHMGVVGKIQTDELIFRRDLDRPQHLENCDLT